MLFIPQICLIGVFQNETNTWSLNWLQVRLLCQGTQQEAQKLSLHLVNDRKLKILSCYE